MELPLGAVRALAVLSLLALLGVGVWTLVERTGMTLPLPVDPTHEVRVEALRNVHVRVRVDGEVREDRDLPGGAVVEHVGQDRVEVEVSEVGGVAIRWNGREVAPVGVAQRPRRLVFVDGN